VLALSEKPSLLRQGWKTTGPARLPGCLLSICALKILKKEEKLMQVKSIIINSQYIFYIPSASNYYAHQS
jgi:hypothetical protein